MKKIMILLMGMPLWMNQLFAQELSPEHMKEDLAIFRQALEKFHPELYRYADSISFEKQFLVIEERIESPMSQRDFYKLLRPVLVSLKDGHVKLLVQEKDQYYTFFDSQLFPLRLHISKDKVAVLGHFRGENVPALAEVKSINGRPIESIISQLMDGLTFGDGESLGGKYFLLNRYFAALFSTEFGVSETYSVELSNGDQTIKRIEKGVTKDQIETFFKLKEQAFSFQILPEKIALMDINRFFTYKGEPNFKKFLNESVETMAIEGINSLILDLRGNEGGNEKYGIELYRFLALKDFRYYDFVTTKPNQKVDFTVHTSKIFKLANSFSKEKNSKYFFTKAPSKIQKPHKSAFKGDLIVLIDGQSFSVTTEFSSRVQADGRATFVGEETSGGAEVNSSGFFSIIPLPNSKIDLGVPRLGFHMADLDPKMNKNRGILPDKRITPSPEDLLLGRDPVLEGAVQLLKK